MSLAQLETVFKKHRTSFEKDAGALIIMAQGRSAIYPVFFTEEQGGFIQVMVWFPPARMRIKRVVGLCNGIAQWVSGIEVKFHSQSKRFYVGAFIKPNRVWPEIKVFIRACDLLLPLLECVGERGVWDEHLVDLAFLPIEDLRPN